MKFKKKSSLKLQRDTILEGAIQGSFHKSLIAIGPVVSEEKIFM
jgi:hypothetical protein